MTADKTVTTALERFARRQLRGPWWHRAWTGLFWQTHRRAVEAAITTPTPNKSVLAAGVRIWMSELRRMTEAQQ
jgi:hypothetical protein